jgi:hypothetical protein
MARTIDEAIEMLPADRRAKACPREGGGRGQAAGSLLSRSFRAVHQCG